MVIISPARYASLWVGLLATAVLSAGGLVLLSRAQATRRSDWARWRTEWQRGTRGLLAAWHQLAPTQQVVALLLGVAALSVRGWVLGHCPITDDELLSYDFYVHPGLALTASNYSLPNNHVLHNLLVGGLGKLTNFSPDLLQRLPAVLVGLGLLPLSYLLLLRHLRFGAATLALGLFTFLPLPVFYAVAGRGYSLQLAATVVGFFAALELLRPGGRRRLPEAAFVLSGILGLYAVPTHAAVLVAFGVVLAATYARQAPRVRWPKLRRLAAATGGIASTAGLLYAPIGAVSGWGALFQNPYVHSSLSWAAYWRAFYPSYLLDNASQLWGHGRWSVPGLAVLLVLGPVALARLRPSRQPLGWLSFAGLFLPLALLLGQRLFAPPRTLLPSVLCSCVLLALLGQEGLHRWRARGGAPGARARQAVALGLFMGLYGAYQLRAGRQFVQQLALYNQVVTRQYNWLRAQRPQRVWLNESNHSAQAIYWHHQGLVLHAPLPLIVADTLPGATASHLAREYVVFNRRQPGAMPPAALRSRVPSYADAYICVWQLETGAEPPAPLTKKKPAANAN
ncbi:MAG: hypothetical protein ACRYG7_52325 [Janthinobacterium lividum]